MKEVFRLYPNCIPVKGSINSIICDLQRGNYEFIPNDLYDILKKFDGKKNKKDIKIHYKNQYDGIIDEYFDFLLEKEFIFFTQNPKYYPKMDLDFHYPFEISNAIIDLDTTSNYNLFKVFTNLDNLNCKFLQIRFYHKIKLEIINDILNFINKNEMIISSISFILQFSPDLNIQILQNMVVEYPRITSFIISNSKKEEYIFIDSKNTKFIIFTTQKISPQLHCGKIKSDYFATNIQMYTEAVNHNSCLHKKIAIDKDGNIKNCPAMPESFGNIKNTTLEQALQHADFKKYWNLTKDEIEACKDCEFRYICTDCRAYTERTHSNENGLDISKPLKCGYDPYTGEWEEWSTNPLKQKAIQYYGIQN
ncbi:hypothetical protein ACM39_13410 [Chryseobacterium sp. FH2]|uniref:grasp-with-spasm system SPASM domain peptide maturase n=1 Tax=Chryseobacterium sp. FH2 TaxID=1674291 RepID=UPI00065A9929|nr:grasp-with-spasm system SPASM domain peptide maturase [Chryseobacterium sp. FH2]KMQ67431.1 hypothetical protein ACM39_13410 [Chryseobacterium sp. FH2]